MTGGKVVSSLFFFFLFCFFLSLSPSVMPSDTTYTVPSPPRPSTQCGAHASCKRCSDRWGSTGKCGFHTDGIQSREQVWVWAARRNRDEGSISMRKDSTGLVYVRKECVDPLSEGDICIQNLVVL